MSIAAARRTVRRKFVRRRLLLRLRMFALVFCGMSVAVGYQLVAFHASPVPVLGAAVVGGLLGLVVGRMSKVVWHEEAAQVIAKMDKLGGLMLAGYLLLAVSRWWILGHWFAGHELTAVALAFTGGIMLGRLLSTRRAVIRILKSQQRY
ncbi:hypothetical protein I2I05_18260 [Hymenobacter sp. BT683]|uniref:Uncharacterized protein n=1 Tax=Hymenobacter jeongseonensis TaxID=2791027 RepID=A0ABS0ILU2_9BACT|nr:hypothetical protein [Hymenobacter jeongseonensis]MBF9239342.1 hypothetical protein [Hymenobacter jeongseonensis]